MSFPVTCRAPKASSGQASGSRALSACVCLGVSSCLLHFWSTVLPGMGLRWQWFPFSLRLSQPTAIGPPRWTACLSYWGFLVGNQLRPPHGFRGSPFVFDLEQCVCNVFCMDLWVFPSRSLVSFQMFIFLSLIKLNMSLTTIQIISLSPFLSFPLLGCPVCALVTWRCPTDPWGSVHSFSPFSFCPRTWRCPLSHLRLQSSFWPSDPPLQPWDKCGSFHFQDCFWFPFTIPGSSLTFAFYSCIIFWTFSMSFFSLWNTFKTCFKVFVHHLGFLTGGLCLAIFSLESQYFPVFFSALWFFLLLLGIGHLNLVTWELWKSGAPLP